MPRPRGDLRTARGRSEQDRAWWPPSCSRPVTSGGSTAELRRARAGRITEPMAIPPLPFGGGSRGLLGSVHEAETTERSLLLPEHSPYSGEGETTVTCMPGKENMKTDREESGLFLPLALSGWRKSFGARALEEVQRLSRGNGL